MTYKLCLKLLAMGKLTADMIDVYFAAGRLTAEQYSELLRAMQTPNAANLNNGGNGDV